MDHNFVFTEFIGYPIFKDEWLTYGPDDDRAKKPPAKKQCVQSTGCNHVLPTKLDDLTYQHHVQSMKVFARCKGSQYGKSLNDIVHSKSNGMD